MNKNGRFGYLEIAATVQHMRKYLIGSYLQKILSFTSKG